MREALSGILRSRHHRLYGTPRDPTPWPFRLFGFEHRDGWFGPIDALSLVLASSEAERDLNFTIMQVKEKFGTLRYYADGMDDFCRGAKGFAEAMSGRLSDSSGRPGLPSRIDRYICILAPGEDPAADSLPEFGPTEGYIASFGPSNALARLRTKWPDTHIDVPAGHADVIGVLIDFLTADEVTVPPPSAVVVQLGNGGENRLIVDMTDLDERRLGGIAVAARLAVVWTDPVTGETGPVDDLGRPAWATRPLKT